MELRLTLLVCCAGMEDLLRVVAFSNTQAEGIFEGDEEEEEEEDEEGEEGGEEVSGESDEDGDEESSSSPPPPEEEQEPAEASKAAVEQGTRPAVDAMDEVCARTLSCQASQDPPPSLHSHALDLGSHCSVLQSLPFVMVLPATQSQQAQA